MAKRLIRLLVTIGAIALFIVYNNYHFSGGRYSDGSEINPELQDAYRQQLNDNLFQEMIDHPEYFSEETKNDFMSGTNYGQLGVTDTVEQPAPTEEPVIVEQPVSTEPDPNSPAGRAEARGLPAPPEIDINSWEFMFANGNNSIGDYTPEVGLIENLPVDSRIVEPLRAMAEDARNQGLSVYLSSGYRSYSEQIANFDRICANNGCSDGKNAQGYYITMPAGCSEHQTGLACDITNIYYEIKRSEEISQTSTWNYLKEHCQDFGFIVRFPEGKEQITEVMFEPYHFRYVGIEAAQYIMANNLCFEEFIELYI